MLRTLTYNGLLLTFVTLRKCYVPMQRNDMWRVKRLRKSAIGRKTKSNDTRYGGNKKKYSLDLDNLDVRLGRPRKRSDVFLYQNVGCCWLLLMTVGVISSSISFAAHKWKQTITENVFRWWWDTASSKCFESVSCVCLTGRQRHTPAKDDAYLNWYRNYVNSKRFAKRNIVGPLTTTMVKWFSTDCIILSVVTLLVNVRPRLTFQIFQMKTFQRKYF